MKKIVYLFLLIIFISSCGLGGTDTGNPGLDGSEEGNSDDGDSPTSACDECSPISDDDEIGIEQIITSLCEKLTQCHADLVLGSCEESMLAVSNIDVEIGLPVNAYDSLLDALVAEQNNEIISDPNQLTECLVDIQDLSCGSISSAYSEAAPTNFNNVYQMIPAASCPNVY